MVEVQRKAYSRFWEVLEDGELLCVTVYKKGAVAVKERIEGIPRPEGFDVETEIRRLSADLESARRLVAASALSLLSVLRKGVQ